MSTLSALRPKDGRVNDICTGEEWIWPFEPERGWGGAGRAKGALTPGYEGTSGTRTVGTLLGP